MNGDYLLPPKPETVMELAKGLTPEGADSSITQKLRKV